MVRLDTALVLLYNSPGTALSETLFIFEQCQRESPASALAAFVPAIAAAR